MRWYRHNAVCLHTYSPHLTSDAERLPLRIIPLHIWKPHPYKQHSASRCSIKPCAYNCPQSMQNTSNLREFVKLPSSWPWRMGSPCGHVTAQKCCRYKKAPWPPFGLLPHSIVVPQMSLVLGSYRSPSCYTLK